MDDRYPPGSSRPPIDQELWERASVVKKNYVKGQGQRRRPSVSGSGSSGSQTTQSAYNPTTHNAAECVRAICRDPALLRELQEHLRALSPDSLADAVGTAANQPEQENADHDDEVMLRTSTNKVIAQYSTILTMFRFFVTGTK